MSISLKILFHCMYLLLRDSTTEMVELQCIERINTNAGALQLL